MAPASADRSDASAPLEAFLSAGLREEPNGMTLSVVSALARLNLDPYREAARLAAMPRRDAATSLARLVAVLHDTGAPVDAARITSLIQLLPNPGAKSLAITARADDRAQEPSRNGWRRFRAAQIAAIIVLAAAVLYLYATAPSWPAQDQPPSSPAAGER